MAKFIKSIFTTTDRRKNSRYEEPEEDKDLSPVVCRRKLSISRSGRMKQANRKRHSLSLELYGENLKSAEKPNNVHTQEYINNQTNQTTFIESKKSNVVQRRNSADTPTPEEEIDIAFQIIDKT